MIEESIFYIQLASKLTFSTDKKGTFERQIIAIKKSFDKININYKSLICLIFKEVLVGINLLDRWEKEDAC